MHRLNSIYRSLSLTSMSKCRVYLKASRLSLLTYLARYVDKYSYFGAFRSDTSNVGPDAAMLTQKGELTDIGAWYLGQEATGNVPKGSATQAATFMGSSFFVIAIAFLCLG